MVLPPLHTHHETFAKWKRHKSKKMLSLIYKLLFEHFPIRETNFCEILATIDSAVTIAKNRDLNFEMMHTS